MKGTPVRIGPDGLVIGWVVPLHGPRAGRFLAMVPCRRGRGALSGAMRRLRHDFPTLEAADRAVRAAVEADRPGSDL